MKYTVDTYNHTPVITVHSEWIDYWLQQQKKLHIKTVCDCVLHPATNNPYFINFQATHPERDAALKQYEAIASQFLLNF
jgi:hypothetical protein